MREDLKRKELAMELSSSRCKGPEAYHVQCVQGSSRKPEGLGGVSGERIVGD